MDDNKLESILNEIEKEATLAYVIENWPNEAEQVHDVFSHVIDRINSEDEIEHTEVRELVMAIFRMSHIDQDEILFRFILERYGRQKVAAWLMGNEND